MKRESSLSEKTQSYLDAKGFYFFKTHGGPFQQSGLPDIPFCAYGRFAAVELKRDDSEKPTKKQLLNIKKIQDAGGFATWCSSLEEVISFVKEIEKSVKL
jgi:hypothetical protein